MKFILKSIISRILSRERKAEVVIDVSMDDWGTFGKIKEGLKKLQGVSKGTLELEILGMSRINPTVILSVLDLLKNRESSVKLIVRIRTNLVDGSLIFPLLADELHLRDGVWFQFAAIDEIEKMGGEDDEDDAGGWLNNNTRVNTVKEPSAITDYRTMSAILGEYLPLAEFKGKRLPLKETLDEFGLIRDTERDSQLTRLFTS